MTRLLLQACAVVSVAACAVPWLDAGELTPPVVLTEEERRELRTLGYLR